MCKKHTKDYQRGIEVLKNKILKQKSLCNQCLRDNSTFEVLKNKILRQKSLCNQCLRDKSTFLKQKHNKKGKIVL